jgi:hypothetical protein
MDKHAAKILSNPAEPNSSDEEIGSQNTLCICAAKDQTNVNTWFARKSLPKQLYYK